MDFTLNASLPAADLDRARAWYSEKMGLEPVDTGPGGELRYEAGGVGFGIYQSMFAGTNQATAAFVSVPDFDVAFADLKSRGVVFEDYDFGEDFRTVDGVLDSPDGKAAWFKDSEGNILGMAAM